MGFEVADDFFTGIDPIDPTGELYKQIEQDFPGLSRGLDVALSVRIVLMLNDVTLPCAVFLVGPPSSNKTTIISMLRRDPETYTVDSFTPASFVSHMPGKSPAKLAND